VKARGTLLVGFVLAISACAPPPEDRGQLRARKVILQREVAGLRGLMADLDGNRALIPPDDVVVAIDGAFVREVIDAQLPFDADVNAYHLRLTRADVRFQESPVVTLGGTLFSRERPDLTADVTAIGALDQLAIDPRASTLSAKVAVDHVGIERLAGLEDVLGGAALDELARAARLRVAEGLPAISIPVSVQQTVEIPRASAGPVRLDAASLPLTASVSRVLASGGLLWIGIHLEPGDFVRQERR